MLTDFAGFFLCTDLRWVISKNWQPVSRVCKTRGWLFDLSRILTIPKHLFCFPEELLAMALPVTVWDDEHCRLADSLQSGDIVCMDPVVARQRPDDTTVRICFALAVHFPDCAS